MKDLTQGAVGRQLLGLSGFLMIGMAVQTLYSLIDIYWVGRLGPSAQAAVTVSGNLMLLCVALSQVLGVGVTALVAQAVGGRDQARAHQVFNQGLVMSLSLAVLFQGGASAFAGPFSRAFCADAGTAQSCLLYLRWFVPSMALQFPLIAMSTALRGTGNMRPGTLLQVATVLLNALLAPLLVFGWLGMPRLGVEGAGLATFLGVAAGNLGLLLYFLRPTTYLKLRRQDWRPQGALWLRIARIGLPSAVEFAMLGCYLLFISVMLRRFGATAQAAFGIGQRLLQAGMLPLMSISFAAAAMAGQNFGAGHGQRVRQTFAAALKIGLSCAFLIDLPMLLAPASLVRPFSTDPAVVAGGIEFIRMISINLAAVAVGFACFGVLSGLGNTLPTLIASAVRVALIIGPTLALSGLPGFRPLWMWEISVGATLVQMSLNLWFLRRRMRSLIPPAQASSDFPAAREAIPP